MLESGEDTSLVSGRRRNPRFGVGFFALVAGIAGLILLLPIIVWLGIDSGGSSADAFILYNVSIYTGKQIVGL